MSRVERTKDKFSKRFERCSIFLKFRNDEMMGLMSINCFAKFQSVLGRKAWGFFLNEGSAVEKVAISRLDSQSGNA